MTLRNRKKVAAQLTKIIKVEVQDARWHRMKLADGLRRLAVKAQQMGLQPEDILTSAGRDAFTVIARAIASNRTEPRQMLTLCSEWQMVLHLAEPAGVTGIADHDLRFAP